MDSKKLIDFVDAKYEEQLRRKHEAEMHRWMNGSDEEEVEDDEVRDYSKEVVFEVMDQFELKGKKFYAEQTILDRFYEEHLNQDGTYDVIEIFFAQNRFVEQFWTKAKDNEIPQIEGFLLVEGKNGFFILEDREHTRGQVISLEIKPE